MKDQHTKIKGYTDLSQDEINLMNELKDLQASVVSRAVLDSFKNRFCQALQAKGVPQGDAFALKLYEYDFCVEKGYTAIMEGFFWLLKGVTQPAMLAPSPGPKWHKLNDVTLSDDNLDDDEPLLAEMEGGSRIATTGKYLKILWQAAKDDSEDCAYTRFLFMKDLPK